MITKYPNTDSHVKKPILKKKGVSFLVRISLPQKVAQQLCEGTKSIFLYNALYDAFYCIEILFPRSLVSHKEIT